VSTQLHLLNKNSLDGFHYQPELITTAEEQELIQQVSVLPFREFEFHGFLGKRRIVSFGWKYDYSGRAIRKADDIPDFLLDLRSRAAEFSGIDSNTFQHVLVTEYRAGSGIGWHRDKPEFGEVVGVSLLAPCVLRFRRKSSVRPESQQTPTLRMHKGPREKKTTSWDRLSVDVEPRSAYHLTGPARRDWYHSILRVDSLRYAITFRTLA
jgi:alkylated DNA repair dioxygenase AlkB